jgi:hypothetical protein
MPDIANATLKEPLINSGPFSCAVKIPERRTVQIKTPIAGNSQSKAGPMSEAQPMSKANALAGASVLGLAKIGNAAMRRSELAHFNQQMLIHELIRGSLSHCRPKPLIPNPRDPAYET